MIKLGQMVLKGVNWIHSDKMMSNGLKGVNRVHSNKTGLNGLEMNQCETQ